MLLVFMGASCTGKSSAADSLSKERNLPVFTGKDYLRLSKNESEARAKFNQMLFEASSVSWAEDSLIYIVTDINDLDKLKISDHAALILFTADPALVKERFVKRLHGHLPKPLEMMLEKQMKSWENARSDLSFDTTSTDSEEITAAIISFCERDQVTIYT